MMDYNEAKKLYEQGELMFKHYKPYRDIQIRKEYYELRAKKISSNETYNILADKYFLSDGAVRSAISSAKKFNSAVGYKKSSVTFTKKN